MTVKFVLIITSVQDYMSLYVLIQAFLYDTSVHKSIEIDGIPDIIF